MKQSPIRTVKRKKCKICKKEYPQYDSFVKWCSPDCAVQLHRAIKEKQVLVDRRAYKRETARRKAALMTVAEHDKKFRPIYQLWIRLRDYYQPCISCGATNEEVAARLGPKTGGLWDAGHWLDVGSHPELKYHEDNCHKQCKSCNSGSYYHARKSKTVKDGYRINLIHRIGQEAVDKLENRKYKPAKYTIDDILEMKADYKARIKTLRLDISLNQDF
jgi:hypothetical protein